MQFLQRTCPYELVEDPHHLNRIIETRFKNIDVVGIDCEKKPVCCKGSYSKLALLQIATRESVILIDVFRLGDENPHLWRKLVSVLFDNSSIIKLGFDLKHDIQMINECFPYINLNHSRNFLDLYSLTEKISGKKYNLAKLVHECLGRPLDKTKCMSNWEERPLSKAQIDYAALDAHCLIQIYDALPTHFDISPYYFDKLCLKLMGSQLGHEMYPSKSDSGSPKPKYFFTDIKFLILLGILGYIMYLLLTQDNLRSIFLSCCSRVRFYLTSIFSNTIYGNR